MARLAESREQATRALLESKTPSLSIPTHAWMLLQFCNVLDHLDHSQPRTRKNIRRDESRCFRIVMRLPSASFFEQTRMAKPTFVGLASIVKPFFGRGASACGPKPAPLLHALLCSARVFGHGAHSWSALAVDWDVGKSTLMQSWVPNVGAVISAALPEPHRARKSDVVGWRRITEGFEALSKLRVVSDVTSGAAWRWRLSRVRSAFPPISEVYEFMTAW